MKFRGKLMLCMLSLLSLLFGVGGSLFIAFPFRELLEREQTNAYHAYQTVLGILQIVNAAGEQSDYADVRSALEQLPVQSTSAWDALRLYDADQMIYQDGEVRFPAGELAHTPGYCTVRYDFSDESQRLLLVSGTLTVGDRTLCLDLANDISPLFAARDTQLRYFLSVFLLLVALCAILSYTFSGMLTRPLTELSNASKDISAGQLSRRAEISTGDEIGLVAADFNRMAESLEKNMTELRESMERQTRFTGSFAHEVKTPMTSIIGYADLIRIGALDGEEQRQAANFIVTEGKRLERLSQRLLQLQMLQGEPIRFSPVRPSALIGAIIQEWGPVYEARGIRILSSCEQGACLMEPELVKSLLLNLLDNARKASEGGPGEILIRSAMRPDGCEITVSDRGQGIPADALEHLTEAFYRVDKSRARALGGVGLGLSLCQEIAALHHGSLHFESEPGEGTKVTVTLKGGIP